MIYRNNSPGAVSEMERQRTGNYGYNVEDYQEKRCPVCGAIDPEDFYVANGDCIGCAECVRKVNYDDYEER